MFVLTKVYQHDKMFFAISSVRFLRRFAKSRHKKMDDENLILKLGLSKPRKFSA